MRAYLRDERILFAYHKPQRPKGKGAKELIDALPEHDREKTLKFLLEGKIAPECNWTKMQQYALQ